MRAKKMLLALWERRFGILLSAAALAVAFAAGWYAHVDHIKAQREDSFFYGLTRTARDIQAAQTAYWQRAQADELDDPFDAYRITRMRDCVDALYSDMQALHPRFRDPYPDACTYIWQLQVYLRLSMYSYSDYRSLEDTLAAAQPLLEGAGHNSIPEALAAITAALETEEGEAAWDIVDPKGLYRAFIEQRKNGA